MSPPVTPTCISMGWRSGRCRADAASRRPMTSSRHISHEIDNFHIHQLHFRVLESDDKFVEGRMLDTINLPVALPDATWWPNDPAMPGKVRLLMRFRPNISGEFVFHYHI